jgi:hypothetical protein
VSEEGYSNIRGVSIAIRHLFTLNGLDITDKDLRDIKKTQSSSQKRVNLDRMKNQEFKVQAAGLDDVQLTQWLLLVKQAVDSGTSITFDSPFHKKKVTVEHERLLRYFVLLLLELHLGIRASTAVTIPFEAFSFKERPLSQRDANDKLFIAKGNQIMDLCLDLKKVGSFKNMHLLFSQGAGQSCNYMSCSCSHSSSLCWVHHYIAQYILKLEKEFGAASHIAHKIDGGSSYAETELSRDSWEKEFKVLTTHFCSFITTLNGSLTSHMLKRSSNTVVQGFPKTVHMEKEVNRHFSWSQNEQNILSYLYNGSSRMSDCYVSICLNTAFFRNLYRFPQLWKRPLDTANATSKKKRFRFLDMDDEDDVNLPSTLLNETEVVWDKAEEVSVTNLSSIEVQDSFDGLDFDDHLLQNSIVQDVVPVGVPVVLKPTEHMVHGHGRMLPSNPPCSVAPILNGPSSPIRKSLTKPVGFQLESSCPEKNHPVD